MRNKYTKCQKILVLIHWLAPITHLHNENSTHSSEVTYVASDFPYHKELLLKERIRSLWELILSLTLSLPNSTVVKFTIHCQTQLQSKLKGTVDSCLFLTVIRDATLCSLFQNVQGTLLYHIWRSTQFSVQKWILQKCL